MKQRTGDIQIMRINEAQQQGAGVESGGDGYAHASQRAPVALGFDDPASHGALVGGKGRNLALMSQAGFRVPPGVTITTQAYAHMLASATVRERIGAFVQGMRYDDTDDLAKRTAGIRELIEATPMPEQVASEILAAYARLAELAGGAQPYVAVRSSGTAEDLAEASFAGLHDTYLDIKGGEALLEAVRRCWASMWTARAVAYRHTNGFDHFAEALAVVVQVMVEADAAGVMFTANPLSERTDEILINSSWGLGEAVVSGIVTPDEFLLRKRNLCVKAQTLGAKQSLIRRKAGGGTLHEETAQARRDQFSLDVEQLALLGDLGRRVEAHSQGLPQDIEWALAGNVIYLLQSRPVTGVNFAWEEDIELPEKEEDEDGTIWEKSWAEEGLTGANCPLFYTTRAWAYDRAYTNQLKVYGLKEGDFNLKHFKYYRSAIYYNTATEKAFARHTMIPHARNSPFCWGGTRFIEPQAHDEIVNAPFSWTQYLKMVARLQLHPMTAYIGCRAHVMKTWFQREKWNPKAFDRNTLRNLDDETLKRTILQWLYDEQLYDDEITVWFYNLRDAINMLAWLVAKWYRGDNPTAMVDLISGAAGETPTSRENKALWEFTQRIRNSPALKACFDEYKEEAFFAKLAQSDEGRAFLTDYEAFAAEHPHRGHSDRDIYWVRRGESPAVDYRAIQALMTADPEDSPHKREKETNARRAAVIEDVTRSIAQQALGPIKVQAFKVVLEYVSTFLVERDLERYSYDKHTYIQKLMFLEVGRRLKERGILTGERDFYFLGKEELFAVLEGHANMTLARAKIAGRMKNFDAYHHKEWSPPPYLVKGNAHDPSRLDDGSDPNRLRGIQQSRGVVTGRARVVKTLDKIGTIQNGEILVCNATDPGWTPAFLIISGIVTETGGVLSHAACLSREYGLPAVQIPNAIQRIQDGATITVNGDTGEVILAAETPEAAEAA